MNLAPDHVEPVPPKAGSLARAALLGAPLLALAWWALAPLPEDAIEAAPASETEEPLHREPVQVELDQAAFHAPLWIAPPAVNEVTAKADPPPPPPPPLKLQILAIVRDSEGDRALLYDPDTDKPIWVKGGQAIGVRTVERVTAGTVEIREGTLLRTLALRDRKDSGSVLERTLRTPDGGPR